MYFAHKESYEPVNGKMVQFDIYELCIVRSAFTCDPPYQNLHKLAEAFKTIVKVICKQGRS